LQTRKNSKNHFVSLDKHQKILSSSKGSILAFLLVELMSFVLSVAFAGDVTIHLIPPGCVLTSHADMSHAA